MTWREDFEAMARQEARLPVPTDHVTDMLDKRALRLFAESLAKELMPLLAKSSCSEPGTVIDILWDEAKRNAGA